MWPFDDAPVAAAPPDWRISQTNPTAELATWRVVADDGAPSAPNVFGVTHTRNRNGTFNLAIAEGMACRDLHVAVRVKAVSGVEDQGGGPIWRARDENNYYIARFNPLEGNYRVYVVVDGKRRQLDSARVETEAGRWYDLRITMRGDRITCYLEKRKLLEATDVSLPAAGAVGLWTKADAATYFDNLIVHEYHPAEAPSALP
ncbi:MAG: hypothetical protein V3T70_11965 [Phycisphaerae bacterium]